MISVIEGALIGLTAAAAYVEAGALVVGQSDHHLIQDLPNRAWPLVLLARAAHRIIQEDVTIITDEEKIEAAKARSEKIEDVGDVIDNDEWAEVGWPRSNFGGFEKNG